MAKNKTEAAPEPAHTPGPWEYRHKWPAVAALYSHGDVIGHIYRDGAHNNSKANAQLVAAAPDLYAALREIIFLDVIAGSINDDAWLQDHSDALAVARAALAKAEGR